MGMKMPTGTDAREAARRGEFVAEFARAEDAAEFYKRLSTNPAADYAKDVRRNRANGRLVSWKYDGPLPLDGHSYTGAPQRWLEYWNDMSDTVGYYGSTFGEPPFGTGRRTAYLNGRAGQASM